MSEQLVYLISHYNTCPSPTTGDRIVLARDYFKIGIATDVDRRVSSINTSTPHKVELDTTIEADNAERVEDELHDLFRFGKYSGEWFRLTSNDINSLRAFEYLEAEPLSRVVNGINRGDLDRQNSLYVHVENQRSNGGQEGL